MTRYLLFALVAVLAGFDAEEETAPVDPGSTGGAGGGGPSYCFDPSDPAVHYQSEDRAVCDAMVLECQAGQFGFDNACGCGCVDKDALQCPDPTDPEITWV